MKIVADAHIPFLRGVLEPWASVTYVPGGKISHEDLRDADALLIRTRTRCNRSLLEGSRVRFIGSATIGVDHIDRAYCEEQGIQWSNAPGCNALSVMQYVASSLAYLAGKHDLPLASLSLGIVGVGNVGSRVERLARILGMRVLLNDPPRERREGLRDFVSLRTVVDEADIISLHVPLDREGPDATFHLCNQDFFHRMERRPFLINTARGEVVDTPALKDALFRERLRGAVIDVWENEPHVDRELLHTVPVATPHIAGYSLDGKAEGTSTVVRALSRCFQMGLDQWYPVDIPPPEKPVIEWEDCGRGVQAIALSCIQSTYRVESDSLRLKRSPSTFEKQRENYPARREFPSYRVILPKGCEEAERTLKDLGFSL